MNFLEKFYAGAFGLILVYLLVKNYQGVNGVLSALGSFNAKTFSTLQGNGGLGININGA